MRVPNWVYTDDGKLIYAIGLVSGIAVFYVRELVEISCSMI